MVLKVSKLIGFWEVLIKIRNTDLGGPTFFENVNVIGASKSQNGNTTET